MRVLQGAPLCPLRVAQPSRPQRTVGREGTSNKNQTRVPQTLQTSTSRREDTKRRASSQKNQIDVDVLSPGTHHLS